MRDGVSIHLKKQLPMGGGLGGGSSDAATVLIALNSLWRLGGSHAELLQSLALPLGADVPVFVYGHDAFAEGVGEALTPVSLPAGLVSDYSPRGVSADRRVYFHRRSYVEIRLSCLHRRTGLVALKHGVGVNDLEAVAVALYPGVAAALALAAMRNRKPAGRVRMSGSGACVFAAFDETAPSGTGPAAASRCLSWGLGDARARPAPAGMS